MKLFKPFVNLTKSESTGVYTLNAVVSVPKDYALGSIEQGLLVKNEKKSWAVTASVTTNGSIETDIVEFSVPLKQGPTEEISTVTMVMVETSKLGSVANPSEDDSTDVNYDDAEETLP
ncbi:hypothetical protein GCQ56_07190 [Marinifilum sp. N1E240]|uniref:hypothetical protein n=1 Tax=Marinifilum sp. N1E240 TaxID=2608082 RepID=UPI00128D8ED6|nr:hypothetical protein [Marinifilum sp. N1E240]MPQ46795.1 hypothetical protein [Marinifilum sp. N1E240]